MQAQATGRMTGRAVNPLVPTFAALLLGVAIVIGIVVAQRVLAPKAAPVSQADVVRQALIDQRADEKIGLSSDWAVGATSVTPDYRGPSSLGYGTRQTDAHDSFRDYMSSKATAPEWQYDAHQKFLDGKNLFNPTWTTGDVHQSMIAAQKGLATQWLPADIERALAAQRLAEKGYTLSTDDIVAQALAEQRAGEKAPLFPRIDPDIQGTNDANAYHGRHLVR
jgi:hypothetical protein